MTKKEIVKNISDELLLPQKLTGQVVQRTLDAIVDALVREGRIELRNFGIFEVKTRAARRGRNPRTGEIIEIPERIVVSFKPGKTMESRVEQIGSKPFLESGYIPREDDQD